MKLIKVEPRKDFKVLLKYSDGTKRVLDGKKLFGLSEYFDELKDEAYFKLASVDFFGAITWPHGQDMSPEWLMEWSEPVK